MMSPIPCRMATALAYLQRRSSFRRLTSTKLEAIPNVRQHFHHVQVCEGIILKEVFGRGRLNRRIGHRPMRMEGGQRVPEAIS
jgi:hypothetical protein